MSRGYSIVRRALWLEIPNQYEPRHENVVCATSKTSDQPVHKRSLFRAFTCPLNIL